jgi:hypothetical protein
MSATPPMTPPTMAPTLLLLDSDELLDEISPADGDEDVGNGREVGVGVIDGVEDGDGEEDEFSEDVGKDEVEDGVEVVAWGLEEVEVVDVLLVVVGMATR